MNTNMFLPKEIKVGFQERGGTYTGKLAYVVYIDEKGVLRKEKSFESWRDQKIDAEQYTNEPMSGFVLNKKAGGYDTGWNHRKTYVRIYDPRGFEFEISVENLLYILDNTSSIIGKGLEGEFVYAWDGKDLVLLPVNAPEYEGLKQLNETRFEQNYVKAKDLKVGATYLTKNNSKIVFLGKFDEFEYGWRGTGASKKEKKQFYFVGSNKGKNNSYSYNTHPSITRKLIQVVDENPHPELAEMFDELESLKCYSPIDDERTERKAMSLESFLDYFKIRRYGGSVIAENGKEYRINIHSRDNTVSFDGEYKEVLAGRNFLGRAVVNNERMTNSYQGKEYKVETLEDVFNILNPHETHYYLSNGRFHHKSFVRWNEHEAFKNPEE